MVTFPNAKEAKEFLVAQIVDEAHREQVPLSDIERKMLYFSEQYWTLPDIMAVNEKFDEEYDATVYEKKIAGLIAGAFKRAKATDPASADSWLNAISMLGREDHYILVMTSQAGLRDKSGSALREMCDPVSAQPASFYLGATLVIAGTAILTVSAYYFGLIGHRGVNFANGSLAVNERLSHFLGYGWLGFVLLAVLFYLMPGRSHRK
jgi:hypothetical protein